MDRLISIGETAKLLGVSMSTLRRWERIGKLIPERTQGNTRRYKLSVVKPELVRKNIENKQLTIAYARVSSKEQADNLDKQTQLLELYCNTQGWNYTLITDIGSGVNYYKKGLKNLVKQILSNKVNRLIITHKDKLLRFGAELVFSICEDREIEVVILNKGEDRDFEEDLLEDVSEIVSIFSARFYDSKSQKRKELLNKLSQTVRDVDNV